jgi:hypothetical protein
VLTTFFEVMMNLPLELLEETLDYLPKSHLCSCSLVAKFWTRPCQKRLFKVVDIDHKNLQRWLNGVSPANVELLGRIRVLTYRERLATEYLVTGPVQHTLREYLPSFRMLRSLTLNTRRKSPLPQPLEMFSAFQYTLLDITLADYSITKSEFVALVNYFPNLMHLHLRYIKYLEEDKSIPPLSRLHFKYLRVAHLSKGGPDLIDELSRLGLHFEEVVISEWDFQHVVDVFGESAKCLRLLISPRGVYSNRCPAYL